MMYFTKTKTQPSLPVQFDLFSTKADATKHAKNNIKQGASLVDLYSVSVAVKTSSGGVDCGSTPKPVCRYQRNNRGTATRVTLEGAI